MKIDSPFRMIVIPANAFDSRARFLQELRERIGGGLVNLSGSATASTLADYLAFLKTDLQKAVELSGKPTEFVKAYHLGFQSNGYWVLSKNVRLYNFVTSFKLFQVIYNK